MRRDIRPNRSMAQPPGKIFLEHPKRKKHRFAHRRRARQPRFHIFTPINFCLKRNPSLLAPCFFIPSFLPPFIRPSFYDWPTRQLWAISREWAAAAQDYLLCDFAELDSPVHFPVQLFPLLELHVSGLVLHALLLLRELSEEVKDTGTVGVEERKRERERERERGR